VLLQQVILPQSAPVGGFIPEGIRRSAKTTGIITIAISAMSLLAAMLVLARGTYTIASASNVLPLNGASFVLLSIVGIFGYQMLKSSSKDVATIGKLARFRLLPAVILLIVLNLPSGRHLSFLPMLPVFLAVAVTLRKVAKYEKEITRAVGR
jgi:hypothetical protein